MKISIIIPAFNEEKVLGESLEEIKRAAAVFAELGWDVELIVCDNNSSDATPRVARDAGAVVVFEKINQIGRARNTGARAASGDWFIFVDADSHPNPELFREVAEAIRSVKYLAGGCTIRLDEPSLVPALVQGMWNQVSRTMNWVAGSFSFIEAASFRETGGFSQELFAAEEIELSQRLKKLSRAKGKEALAMLPELYQALDKAAKHGTIAKNKAARMKSRITKRLSTVSK